MAQVKGFETIGYNGFVFPAETDLTISMRPRPDQADRAVVANVYTIEADFLIAEYDNQNLPVAARDPLERVRLPQIRRLLGEWGKTLVLRDTGYGDLSVNDFEEVEWFDDHDNPIEFDEPVGRQDVNWGPKVRDLIWQPLGPRAARVRWVCEVAIKECEDEDDEVRVLGEDGGAIPRLMAYNFSVSHAKDEQGYVTRTVTGYLEIPMTRPGGGREMPNNAEAFLVPQVIPKIPKGFARGPVQTSLSEDKRRLNFSFVDTELPQRVLPEGVVSCRASHSVSTSEKSLSFYRAVIRANYVLRKDLDKGLALRMFFQLIAQRLRAAQQGGMRAFIPLSLHADDPDLYGREAASFAFGYSFSIAGNNPGDQNLKGPFGLQAAGGANGAVAVPVGPFFLDQLQKRSGLWGPAPGGDEEAWKKSMQAVFHPRGLLGIGQLPADDWIVDLCDVNNLGNVAAAGDKQVFRVANPAIGKAVMLIPVPPESVFKYDTRLEVLIDDPGLISYRKMQGVAAVGANAAGGLIFNPLTNWLLGLPPLLQPPKIVPFRRTTPRLVARLDFDIATFQKAAKIPNLTGVAGLASDQIIRATDADIRGRGVPATHDVQRVANLWGIDLVRLRGYQYYVLIDAPTDIPEHPPDYFIDGKPAHAAGWNGVNNFAL